MSSKDFSYSSIALTGFLSKESEFAEPYVFTQLFDQKPLKKNVKILINFFLVLIRLFISSKLLSHDFLRNVEIIAL